MKLRVMSFALVFAALVGTASSQMLVSRVNCGGAAINAGGLNFTDDLPYLAGIQDGFVGGGPQAILSDFGGGVYVGGNDNPYKNVYRHSRVNWSAYRFEIPNGDYILRLFFCEPVAQGVSIRSFDVRAEGQTIVDDLDIAAEIGVQYGGIVTSVVTVADGRLDVESDTVFTNVTSEGPMINAIEIWTAPASVPAPPAPSGFEAKSGYHANIISWDWDSDETLGGYRLYRADAMGGPFAPIATLWSAPARYIDRSAVVGTEHFYELRPLDLDGVESTPTGIESAIALDSANSTLPVYDIVVQPNHLEFISNVILTDPKVEVPGTMTFNGTTYNVEVRFRGGSGRLVSKKSWKVKFSSSERFEGQEEINLKAHFLDPSLIRERLAGQLYSPLEVYTQQLRPVHLRVNGEYLGVYNQLEQMDNNFLARIGRDTDSNLYKCEANLKEVPTLDLYRTLYEKQTNETGSHDDVIALIQFLNNAPSAGFELALADQFDIQGYLAYMAVIGFVGDLDSVVHNYFLLNDFSLGRWEIIPFDSDVNFGLVGALTNLSIMAGTNFATPGFTNQLRERVMTVDALRWRYTEMMKDLVQRFGNNVYLDPVIDTLHGDIAVDAHADPFKFGWESDGPFDGQVSHIKNVVAARAGQSSAEANFFQPASPPTLVWINELSASTQTTHPDPDDPSDFDDWVELYNASGSLVDLSGLFLTNDLSQPMLWSIPMGTTIPANGHLVIYCDGEPGEGPLHTTFTLSEAGGELGLIDTDGATVLDFIHWRPQRLDVSYGRYEDGKPFFNLLANSTPNAANDDSGDLPPSISVVEIFPDFPSSTDMVRVDCVALDAGGVSSVMIHWRVGGGGFTTQAMTAMPNSRYEVNLPAQPDGSIVEYYIEASDGSGIALRPNDAPAVLLSYTVTDPLPLGIHITEIVARNDSIIADPQGDFDDYVEIYNSTSSPIDISGMFLTDDFDSPTKWQIPNGNVVPAFGQILIWADNDVIDGGSHANFALSGNGEEIALFDRDGLTLVDGFFFGSQIEDEGYGRLPDDDVREFRLLDPSPLENNLPLSGQVDRYDYKSFGVNTVTLEALAPLNIDSLFPLDIQSSTASANTTLFFDFQSAELPMGADGFMLLNPSVATPPFMTDGTGHAGFSLFVPHVPALVEFTVYVQAHVAGEGFSNGLVATIGLSGSGIPSQP